MQYLTKCFNVVHIGLAGLVFVISADVAPAGGVAECESVDCLQEQILGHEPVTVSESDCAAFDGKQAKGFLKPDLGEICRLFDARRKVASRELHPCHDDGSMNPDWNSRLYDLPLDYYAREIYQQIPRKLRWADTLEDRSYGKNTRYGTYELGTGRHNSDRKDKTKSEEKFDFDVYFCQSGGFIQPQFYTPYFYKISKKIKKAGADEWVNVDKRMVYIEEPPLADVMLFRQLPDSLKTDYKKLGLGDFNGDGQADLIFIETTGYKKYRPGVCFYDKGKKSCRKVMADKDATTEIFWRKADFTWQENSHIMLIISERENKKPREYSRYEYREGGFVLTGTKKGAKP